jgi:hypothetical protein
MENEIMTEASASEAERTEEEEEDEDEPPVIYQLKLGAKNPRFQNYQHVEVVYKWCSVHNIAYSVKVLDYKIREMKRQKVCTVQPPNPNECPLCYRQRVPHRGRNCHWNFQKVRDERDLLPSP